MKKIFGLVVAGAILMTTSFADFTDVKTDHWAYSAISKMQKTGILSGYSDGSFAPGKNITLAEFAAIFTKIFEIPQDNTTNYFTDVGNDHWAKGYLEAIRAYVNPYYDSIGEAIGVTDYSYLEGLTGDMEITRETFIYAVSRIYGYDTSSYTKGEEKKLFADYKDILFPKETVLAYKNGVISGEKLSTETYIRPKRSITRAEASAIFNNLLKYEAKRVTNKNEAPQLKAAYSEILKRLKESGIASASTFVYDTRGILTNENFKLSESAEKALYELLLIVLSDYKYEITDAGFYHFDKGYIKINTESYDVSSYMKELMTAVSKADEDTINKIVSELKDGIENKQIKKTSREETISFHKYDGEWKLILQ